MARYDVYPVYKVRNNKTYSALKDHEFSTEEAAKKFAQALNDAHISATEEAQAAATKDKAVS